MVESRTREHHGHFIGPLRLVLPLVHLMVPEMQAAWVAYQPVRKFPPDLGTEHTDKPSPVRMSTEY